MEAFPRISARNVRYIKLGEAGCWEKASIDEGVVRFGFDSGHPDTLRMAESKDWTALAESWRATRKVGTATRFANETRLFFEAGPDDLWITFVGERFYWGFLEASAPVPQSDESTIRRVKDGWRCIDRLGKPLLKSHLPGSFTKLAAYRGTSCSVDVADQVVRRINAEISDEVRQVEEHRAGILTALVPLIRRLGPNDLEVLVELIFGASGWRRTATTGGARKLLDLDLELPSTGEHAFVQVKARTGQAEFDRYVQDSKDEAFNRMFYVFHTGKITSTDEKITLVDADKLAHMTLDAGLLDWVIRKAE